MKSKLLSKHATEALITSGKKLLLAGESNLLETLPKGCWIGGSIPYFMDEVAGGCCDREQIHVTELPDLCETTVTQHYGAETITNVYKDGPDHGISFIIIPAATRVQMQFALEAPDYEEFASHPMAGWIAGVHLDELGSEKPKVFDGQTGESFQEDAVVMRVSLPETVSAEIGILNIFEQGDGAELYFPDDSFEIETVEIDGETINFAAYLTEQNIDTKLPLVADMAGANINTSVQSVDVENGKVILYAPVFRGVGYKIANPIRNYAESFQNQVPDQLENGLTFSCNCILNYLYAELEGKKTDRFTGPITFGEIAYQLLNQTLVYVTISQNG